MNIGDRVRLLHGSEEGIITKFINEKMIEVEIEDGFQIPVMKNEVVVIAKEEADYFSGKAATETPFHPSPVSKTDIHKGLFLAFFEINDKVLALYFINNTEYDIAYSFNHEIQQNYQGISIGICKTKEHVKVKEFEVQQFDNWPALVFQGIFHKKGNHAVQSPLVKKIKFKASVFFKSKGKAPLLDKQGFIFQIDSNIEQINPEKLKESLYKPTEGSNSYIPVRPQKMIDLHIEKLQPNSQGMSNREIIRLQMETFEKNLDAAIATGMDEITFIHGVGNGVLRNEIQKKLSQMKNIKFFKDSMKEKFGFGATTVTIK
jgi:hypothetical protein